eukprot:354601-Chlamydomonas_euryale.AAC.2
MPVPCADVPATGRMQVLTTSRMVRDIGGGCRGGRCAMQWERASAVSAGSMRAHVEACGGMLRGTYGRTDACARFMAHAVAGMAHMGWMHALTACMDVWTHA